MKVPGGWIYETHEPIEAEILIDCVTLQERRKDRVTTSAVFVPYNEEFKSKNQ